MFVVRVTIKLYKKEGGKRKRERRMENKSVARIPGNYRRVTSDEKRVESRAGSRVNPVIRGLVSRRSSMSAVKRRRDESRSCGDARMATRAEIYPGFQLVARILATFPCCLARAPNIKRERARLVFTSAIGFLR